MIAVQNKIFIFIIFIFFMISNANSNKPHSDKFTINPGLKERIMHSPYKATLHGTKGRKIIAYLYAEDEQSKPFEYYSCKDGEEQKLTSKTGHYFIYLYDVNSNSFFPNRTAVFPDFDGMRMGVEGADLYVLHSINKDISDVLLISQFGDCNGDFYEAYGFSKDQSFLKKYIFVSKQKDSQFYGRVGEQKDGKMIAYTGMNNIIKKLSLSLSIIPGEIQIKTEHGNSQRQ